MAYRPTWQGHLELSLVTCPVALYTAIKCGSDVHFHLIIPKITNRIKMFTTDADTGPIERKGLVKVYEVSKVAPPPDDTNIIDLMSALEASLSGKGKSPEPTAKPAQGSKASTPGKNRGGGLLGQSGRWTEASA